MAGPALAYLRKEARYLRSRSGPAADRFLAAIATARKNLSMFTEFGFEKHGIAFSTMRQVVVNKEYILDYEIMSDAIVILLIRPAAIPENKFTTDEDFDFEDDGSAPPPPGSKL